MIVVQCLKEKLCADICLESVIVFSYKKKKEGQFDCRTFLLGPNGKALYYFRGDRVSLYS